MQAWHPHSISVDLSVSKSQMEFKHDKNQMRTEAWHPHSISVGLSGYTYTERPTEMEWGCHASICIWFFFNSIWEEMMPNLVVNLLNNKYCKLL